MTTVERSDAGPLGPIWSLIPAASIDLSGLEFRR
jgi:hypothetical protein